MSYDWKGGINYPLLKNHYDLDDYVEIGFTGVEDNPLANRQLAIGTAVALGLPGPPLPGPLLSPYTVGTMSILNDPTQVTNPAPLLTLTFEERLELVVSRGWSLTTPATIGIPSPTPPPAYLPSFEAKDLLFYADQPCWVRFDGPSRVRHYIPAATYKRYHRRCFILYVVRATDNDGTLQVDIEG